MTVADVLPVVHATLNYTKRPDFKPHIYMYDPPPGVPRMTGELDATGEVPIHDARGLSAKLSLDHQGFVLCKRATRVANFYDETEVRSVYYPEVEALLKAETGADKVVIFDHTIRSADSALSKVAPARTVHNDYTERSATRRVKDHVGGEEAEARLRGRFAEINVWRPIVGPVEDAPLALCDARTVAADDFIAGDLIYRDKVGEHYRFGRNPDHRWYYFPRMRPTEAILLKCFDSDPNAKARFTPHSAFDDPTAPAERRPRESIEVRALVFFPPQA